MKKFKRDFRCIFKIRLAYVIQFICAFIEEFAAEKEKSPNFNKLKRLEVILFIICFEQVQVN